MSLDQKSPQHTADILIPGGFPAAHATGPRASDDFVVLVERRHGVASVLQNDELALRATQPDIHDDAVGRLGGGPQHPRGDDAFQRQEKALEGAHAHVGDLVTVAIADVARDDGLDVLLDRRGVDWRVDAIQNVRGDSPLAAVDPSALTEDGEGVTFDRPVDTRHDTVSHVNHSVRKSGVARLPLIFITPYFWLISQIRELLEQISQVVLGSAATIFHAADDPLKAQLLLFARRGVLEWVNLTL